MLRGFVPLNVHVYNISTSGGRETTIRCYVPTVTSWKITESNILHKDKKTNSLPFSRIVQTK